MKTGVRKLFLASSCVALLATSPVMADETAHETHAVEAPDAGLTKAHVPTPEENLIAATLGLKETLESRSKQVLAASGDRSTSEARKSLSIWLSALASDLDDGLTELGKASAELQKAESREQLALVEARHGLLMRLEAAMADVEAREGDTDLPPTLKPVVDEIIEELTTLQATARDLEDTRNLVIDLSFAEPLSDEDRLTFDERLAGFQSETGVLLTADAEGVATSMRFEGTAPVSLTAMAMKAALNAIWTPAVPELEEGAEAPVIVDLPDPSFVGITLD